MRDYIIMTDSCCDLSQQEVEELELTVLPLSFTIEGKTLLNTPDHADMSPEEFFAKIAAGADCTTAAVNVGQFTDAMEKVLQEGKDILCVCFSSALSTTYQSACIAAEDLREKYPEAKILVIDSLSASRGQGMLLYRAVRERREKNLTIDELDAYVRSIIQSQCHWFIVDDLNHLKRGGRVSSTAALVGTMLGIKPVIKKFVPEVGHITFSGNYARKHKQHVLYITERAVFEMKEDGVHLTEIAPGIDLQKDVLDQMGFTPIIDEVKVMPAFLFEDKPMGLKKMKEEMNK